MRLIADTHTHTLASNHAYSTVMENIVAAREQGLLYMAMTEHGRCIRASISCTASRWT